jgi:hypothetical protein
MANKVTVYFNGFRNHVQQKVNETRGMFQEFKEEKGTVYGDRFIT